MPDTLTASAPMKHLGHNRGRHWQVDADSANLATPPPAPRNVTVVAQPQQVRLDLHRSAIIVVDMQNDFCSAGGWLDHIGVDYRPARAPIAPLRRLLPVLRAAGVPVIWVNWGNRPDKLNLSPALLHVYNPSGSGVGLGDPVPGREARTLEKGSWGAAVVDELVVDDSDVGVDKYRMSGFWDTPLDAILRNLDVRTLLLAGVNADQCVLHTLADANFLGYDTLLLEDCSATTSPDYCWQATLYNVRQIFGFTLTSSDLIAAMAAAE
jgi:nicotinamidase-related amidase